MTEKNIILLDSAPQKEWNFSELLEERTKMPWEIWHIDSHFNDSGLKKKMKFFWFPIKVLRKRKDFHMILSFQQFYGLILALYCEIFHLKKKNRLFVATFIYRPKKGIVGGIYFRFMKKAVQSRYIDKIICFSSTEPKYYENLFSVKPGKFTYVSFAVGDVTPFVGNNRISDEKFILSAGKSNRDYDFLVDALKNTKYQVRILSDEYFRKDTGNNIKLYHDVFGKEYYEMLAKCFCVIVPLADTHISAGQFVFLQSMMFGKPVIVTESETVGDYIEDRINGFIIDKEKETLIRTLNELYGSTELYQEISGNGRKIYMRSYSLESMADQISELCRQMEEGER